METNDISDSFIFIGKGTTPESACKAIYQSLCISQPTQLEITEKDFQYKFDLYENLSKYTNQYIQTFKETYSNII